MVDFWYLVLKKFYSNDIALLYSDTDSFIIRVKIIGVKWMIGGGDEWFGVS